MKKKYLFLTITEDFAGAEHVQVDYLRYIDYEKYTVLLGVKKDVFSPYLEKAGLAIKVVSLPDVERKDRFCGKFYKYVRFLIQIKPECVVFNQFWLQSFGLAEILAAFFVTKGNVLMFVHDCPPVYASYNGKKYFGFLDFGLSWRMSRLFQSLLGYFTKKTIAVSKASRDALVNGHKFPIFKVKVVYHGVDRQIYHPSQENKERLRRDLNILSEDIVIVSTAMLWPNKRIDRLIEAFTVVVKEQKNIRLLIAGKGSESDRLNDMVKSLDKAVGERIRFLGFRNDIPFLLQASDIYVLSSDSEGLPIACLEAMACGLPIVVTDSGGTSEILQNGYNGFLVEKNVAGVANGIQRVLDLNVAQEEEMSQNARKFVENNFNLEKNILLGLKVLGLNNG